MLFNFLWKNRTHYIRDSVMMNDYEHGGLNAFVMILCLWPSALSILLLFSCSFWFCINSLGWVLVSCDPYLCLPSALFVFPSLCCRTVCEFPVVFCRFVSRYAFWHHWSRDSIQPNQASRHFWSSVLFFWIHAPELQLETERGNEQVAFFFFN